MVLLLFRKRSPLKSATITDLGLFPTAKGEPSASVKSPVALPLVSLLPNNTETLFEVEFTRTTSGGWMVENFVVSLRKTPLAMATWPVSLAASVIGDGVT